MDQLLPDQQESLRKTNTERLRVMAAKTGEVDEEKLMTLDRLALLEIVANDILDRKEVEKGATYRWLPSVGPGADPGVQAVSPQVT